MTVDPFAALVFEPLNEQLKPWVGRVNELGLCLVASPDGQEAVIFNDDHLDRGCVQVKASGEIRADLAGRPWGVVTEQEALDHMRNHLAR